MTTKQRILTLLEENKGTPLSGEALAQTLGLSRAAVWKSIKELQKQGHAISATPHTGYTLCTESDVLSLEGLRPYLHIAQEHAVVAESLPSTNLTAKQLAGEGAPHGTLVVAEAQTAGRGRRGRSFASPLGTGLYLSVVLRSALPMESAALITSAAAVAVCRALQKVCGIDEVQIKWVNDLYYNGKKCCGILTEATANFETGELDSMVVGIGLNLYEPEGGFAPELADIATALFEKDFFVSRCALAAAITNELLLLCEALPSTAFMEEYRSRNLVPGKDIFIIQNGTKRPAHALHITDSGHLVVQLPNGTCEELSFGEVSVRIS